MLYPITFIRIFQRNVCKEDSIRYFLKLEDKKNTKIAEDNREKIFETIQEKFKIRNVKIKSLIYF